MDVSSETCGYAEPSVRAVAASVIRNTVERVTDPHNLASCVGLLRSLSAWSTAEPAICDAAMLELMETIESALCGQLNAVQVMRASTM